MQLFSKPFEEFSEKSLHELRSYVYHYLDYKEGYDDLMEHRQVSQIVLEPIPEKPTFEDLIERESVVFKHKITCSHFMIDYYPDEREPWVSGLKLNDGFLEIIVSPHGFKAGDVLEEWHSKFRCVKEIIDNLNKKIDEYNEKQLKVYEEEKAKYDSGFYNARKLIDELNEKIAWWYK